MHALCHQHLSDLCSSVPVKSTGAFPTPPAKGSWGKRNTWAAKSVGQGFQALLHHLMLEDLKQVP